MRSILFITSKPAKAVFVMLGQGNVFSGIEDCSITKQSILISRNTFLALQCC